MRSTRRSFLKQCPRPVPSISRLPASFGIPDLAESGILVDLDQFAAKHEPEGYQDSIIYKTANYYKGNFYGYETDGDAYVMFYRQDWINDPEERKRYADKYGKELKVPDTWEELDQQLAFFHRPESGRYGGALFRSQYFIAWEWWVRFHAKGFFPFTDDLAPQINNEAGVKALEELAAASKYLYPGARSNGLFENFEGYGKGRQLRKHRVGRHAKIPQRGQIGRQREADLRSYAGRHRERGPWFEHPILTGAGTMSCRVCRRNRKSPTCSRSMP